MFISLIQKELSLPIDKLMKMRALVVIVLAGTLGFSVLLVNNSELLFGELPGFTCSGGSLVLKDEAETTAPSINVPSLTIVTMFLRLGSLQKGFSGLYNTDEKYAQWMVTWGWLNNHVVAFIEDEEMLLYFKKIRTQQPAHKTVIVKMDRSQLNAFKYLERIESIFSNRSYPKHPPNTINANYSCTVSAKYDALNMALEMGLVKTKYLAWMDIGLFRNLLNEDMKPKNNSFTMEIPADFNSSRVGVTQVSPRQAMEKFTPWEYIRDNKVWVAGGHVMGSHEVIRPFIKSYKYVSQELIKAGMASTDEQVIGAMYSPEFRHLQKVDVQGYSCVDGQFGLHGSDVQYFCLSYICKEAGEMAKNRTSGS